MSEGADEASRWPLWGIELERRLKTYIHTQLHASEARIIKALTNTNEATGLRILIGGVPITMGQQFSVDLQNGVVSSQWTDDKGDVVPAGPAGASVQYASSDTSVANVDPISGALSIAKAGDVTFSANPVDANGDPVPGETSGTVDVTFTPGGPTGLMASVSGNEPQPVPAHLHRVRH